MLNLRGFLLPPGLSLVLQRPQVQLWWAVGRCFRDHAFLYIPFHFPQPEFITCIYPPSLVLFIFSPSFGSPVSVSQEELQGIDQATRTQLFDATGDISGYL